MSHCCEIFRSAGPIWLLWFVSTSLLVWCFRATCRRIGNRGWQAFLADEQGAAYSLSFILTFPFYLLLVCLAVESTLLLVTKVGTTYAAFAAARSAAVWESALPSGRADSQAQLAASLAMVPFASGSSQHANITSGAGLSDPARLAAYVATYRQYAEEDSISLNYVRRKFQYADSATRVRLEPTGSDGRQVAAVVEYETPLHIPGVGRLLGHRPYPGAPYFTFLLQSRAVLPSETPRSETGSIGIRYLSQ